MANFLLTDGQLLTRDQLQQKTQLPSWLIDLRTAPSSIARAKLVSRDRRHNTQNYVCIKRVWQSLKFIQKFRL